MKNRRRIKLRTQKNTTDAKTPPLRGAFRDSVSYCKNSFLNSRTQMQSIQPTNTPRKVTTKLMTNLTAPPFLKKVDHLTMISTT